MKMNADTFRNKLCLSASALVFAACMGTANAADVTLGSGNTPWSLMSNATIDTLVIASGQTGYLTADYNTAPAGMLGITWSGSPSMSATGSCSFGGCYANADIIKVNSGGKIFVDNPWGWQPFEGMFNVAGDAEFGIANWGGGTTILMGANTFSGNLILDAGVGGNTNLLQIGQDWKSSALTLGSNANIVLNSGSMLEMWLSGSAVAGGTVSGSGSISMHTGTLTINGTAVGATAFTGAVTLGPGANLVVGDATHSGAVFGDVTAAPASVAATINVTQSGGTLATLKGYGNINATVNNDGIVVPGGTLGTLGTLTVSKYNQAATGVLQVEVSPTGASKLNVLGNASLNGSLVVRIGAGDYGNAVFPIVSAGSISGSFSAISTTGSVSGAIVALQTTSTGYNIVTEKASNSQVIGHLVTANRYDMYNFSASLYDVLAGGVPSGSKKVTVWATPTGRIDSIGRDGLGYSLTSYGVSGGVQYGADWHNAVIGVALSYDHASLDVKHESTTADTDTVNIAAYGGFDVQNARIDGMVFYNTYDASTEREMTGFGTAAGKPSGWGWGGSVQISRPLFNDRVIPFARGTFARVAQDSLEEDGVPTFDLAYNGIDANTFVADIGLRVNILPAANASKLQALVAIRHDFSDPGETIEGSFANLSGSTFRYHWAGDSGNTLLLGLNAATTLQNKLQLFGRVGTEFSQYRRSAAFQIGAKYRF